MNRYNDSELIFTCFHSNNKQQINDDFCPHKLKHKTTWTNTTGQTSIMDDIITHRSIRRIQILDMRVLTSELINIIKANTSNRIFEKAQHRINLR